MQEKLKENWESKKAPPFTGRQRRYEKKIFKSLQSASPYAVSESNRKNMPRKWARGAQPQNSTWTTMAKLIIRQ